MDEYAVFVFNSIPIIARVSSVLYKKLLGLNKWCITGTIDDCVNFADDVISVIVTEMEEAFS